MRNALRTLRHELRYDVLHLLGRDAAALDRAREVAERMTLIFCVTNGRSGTDTLSRLFGCIEGVTSRHEASPPFHWVMRRAQSNPEIARQFWLHEKLPALATVSAAVHVDTTHLFGKGFFEPLVGMDIIPDLVLLRRNRRAIAKSLYMLDTIPGRTRNGLKWYLSPGDRVILGLPGWQNLSSYELCYWHTLEMEARQRAYGGICKARGGRVVDVDLEDLDDSDVFFMVAAKLGLALSAADRGRIAQTAGQRFNQKVHKRCRGAVLPADDVLGELERRVERLVMPSDKWLRHVEGRAGVDLERRRAGQGFLDHSIHRPAA